MKTYGNLSFQFILFLSIGLFSCGSKDVTTLDTTMVVTSALTSVAGQTGGVILFGQNLDDENDSFYLTMDSDSTSIELNNGQWEFMAVAWDGYNSYSQSFGNTFEGTLRCGEVESLNLEGGDQSLSMSLSVDNCSSDNFGLSSTKSGSVLKPTEIEACSNIGIYSESSNEEYCYSSPVGSFQLVLLAGGSSSYDEVIGSRCVKNETGVNILNSSTEPHDFRLPIFFPRTIGPFWSLRTFSDSSCSVKVSEAQFNHPYANVITGNSGRFESSSDDSTNTFSIFSSICETEIGSASSPYTSTAYNEDGDSMGSSYYTMCTAEQMASGFSDSYGAYRLGQDINFNSSIFSSAFFSGTFMGSLDGQGFALKNLSFDFNTPAGSYLGLFESVDAMGSVSDLKIVDSGIKCSGGGTGSDTGTGFLAGSFAGNLSDIVISNMTIENDGCERLGGLVGTLSGSAEEITFNDSNFRNDGDLGNIGGLVGELSGTLSYATFSNFTMTQSAATSSSNVGGLVGYSYTGSVLNTIYGENITLGQSTAKIDIANSNIGLIIGNAEGNVSNAKVQGSLYTSNTNSVGGVIGRAADGIFSNLVFEGGEIFSSATKAAGVIGLVEDATVNYIRSSGRITCDSTCGGLVGEINISTAGASFKNGHSSLEMNTELDSGSVISDVGGIIGYATGDGSNSLSIKNIQFDGSIDISSNTNASNTNIGGIIGAIYTDHTLENIVNHGAITVDSGFSGYVAGIVGNISSGAVTIDNIINTGLVSNYGSYNPIFANGSVTSSTYIYCDTNNGSCAESAALVSYTSGDLTNITTVDSSVRDYFEGDGTDSIDLSFVYRLENLDALTVHGSYYDPILIDTPEKWNLVSDNEIFMNSAIRLTGDLDFSSIDFTPIGSETNPYSSFFNGNDYTISNISYTPAADSVNYAGLFASLGSGALINLYDEENESLSHLYLDNIAIEIESSTGEIFAGILSGKSINPLGIVGVEISGNSYTSIIESSGMYSSYGGGLIGDLELSSESEVNFYANYISNSSVSLTGGDATYVGGFFGRIFSGTSTSSKPNYNFRAHKLTNVALSTDSGDLGGFAGKLDNSAVEYYNFENILISGDSEFNGYNSVGGLFAYASYAEIRNSAVTDISILSSNTGGVYAGGLVGNLAGSTIETSYASVTISATDSAGCLIAGADTVISTLESNYANCSSLSGASIEYFAPISSGYIYTSEANSNLYTHPSGDQGYSDFAYVTYDELADKEFVTTNFPAFNSDTNWFWSVEGEPPRHVMEVYPEYFFP